MFNKIQMILMMKTSISNNRIWRLKNKECTERQKTSFSKEYVENADLHKPV